MSTFEKISPDDPRLTAFALGEMEPAERTEFEKLLAHDADARVALAAISGTAHHIGAALASEPVPTFALTKADPDISDINREYAKQPEGMGRMLRFPQLYFTISGLAAACFAIGFIIWQTGQVPTRQVHYTEVDLTKLVPAEAPNAKEAVEAIADDGVQPALAGNVSGVVALEEKAKDNSFLSATSAPRSTFPIKTRTAAYGNVRQLIERGQRPHPDTVRIEEMVNAFAYHYAPPDGASLDHVVADEISGQAKPEVPPFAAHLEVASAPWSPENRLVRIGPKGRVAQQIPGNPNPPSNVIAKSVNIQVEFNPAQVQAYRMIGYENRVMRKEDFNSGNLDAGEVVSGHTVTALYEVVPTGADWKPEDGDDRQKFRTTANQTAASEEEGPERAVAGSDALLTLKLRYDEPNGEASKLLEFSLSETGRTFDQASADFKFAASVAAFGMILRNSPHKGQATYARVSEWAQAGLSDDSGGYRAEFVGLVGQAERLAQN